MHEYERPLQVGNRTAVNRIVYQPTETNNCSEKGEVSELTIETYRKRAEGRPGFLHIESVDVTPAYQARSNRMVITEENLEGYQRLVKTIKQTSAQTLVIFQLSHPGRLSDRRFAAPALVYRREGDDASIHMLTTEEVIEARDQFVEAAVLVHRSGADGIDFKQAHGFLADDFLHPANDRPDQYGGTFENRIRFFTEAYRMIRERVADPSFLIGTRISPFEGIAGGCGTASARGYMEDFTEMLEYVRHLEAIGVDFINVSAGYAAANLELLMPTDTYPEGVPRLFGWTRMISQAVSIPVIGSGYSYLKDGSNRLQGTDKESKSLLYMAEENLKAGFVDAVGIGRQVLADPLFALKVTTGREEEVKWCTTCGRCTALLGANKAIGCTVYDPFYEKLYANLR